MSKFLYLLGEGFRSIFKHGFMSFATVSIITACLIIIGSVSVLSINIDALINELESQNEVVAFVDEKYTEDEAKALESKVRSAVNVGSVEFMDRETAMESFMGNYDEALMEGIDSSVFRDRYIIKLDDIVQMAQTKAALENIEGIVKVNAHLDYAKSFITVRNVVRIVTIVLIAMLLFVSFFIMSNTIKLATYSRREEIGIMKMVGAGNTFIRMPFIIEGLLLGLLGAGLAFVALYGIYELLSQKMLTSSTGMLINVVPFSRFALPMLMAFTGVGFLVGTFGGVNAIRNYLKV